MMALPSFIQTEGTDIPCLLPLLLVHLTELLADFDSEASLLALGACIQ